MNNPIPAELVALLERSNRILCISHINPDGDAYGSLLGMVWLLRTLGKQATPAMTDPLLSEFEFLPGATEIVDARHVGADYDLVICLDASSPDRMGDVFQPELHAALPLAVIDHHVTNTYFGDVNWVDPSCAATAQMLTYLVEALGAPTTGAIAECLLTGIITDTLSFRTSNTTPEVLEAAMRLQRAGADLSMIVQRTLNRMPFSALQLWSLVLPSVQLEDGVLWGVVTRDQLRDAGQPNDDSKLNSIFATIIEADISAVFTEKIGKNGQPAVECSFRAKPGFNVGDLAFAFGGGGHPPASGCTLEGPTDQVVARVVAALKETRRRQALDLD
ncbi:MAG: bifunctional oligoribonuclease/PAP phosphatase NrnA [Anaerolineales bacterium]|nr:bifunctional oligoribonuclease/PAP phosphatase NrnA [Anaerolineales bacterium]